MVLQKCIRILLIGDQSVGKTSLILSLVSEEFPENVPPKAEEITIPPDVTPEQVPTHIVDFSEREQTVENLREELKHSDVICIVYSVEEEETLDNVTDHWLPLIRSTLGSNHGKPVVLVGNKIDLVDYSTMEIALQVMMEYPEIETCVECSAKTLKNISEMFYYAQKAVLHPTAPLYVLENRDLTEKCKNALVRIFRLCDDDNDGLLNDNELNTFQKLCFNSPLNFEALEELKRVVEKNLEDGIMNGCLTQKGFLFLHRLFIQRGRHETTWTVLRKFGYDDEINLSAEHLYPPLSVGYGCTTELNHSGYCFLLNIFDKYDQDKDGCLSPTELVNVFSTCPLMPWGLEVYNSVLTDCRGWIKRSGFLSQWTLWTLLEPRRTLEYLAHLGYISNTGKSQLTAITITREKKIDLEKKQTMRNVYQCHVIGPKGSGKTTFCQGLLGKTLDEVSRNSDCEYTCRTINTTQVYGQEKYLVLHDIDVTHDSDPLMPDQVLCDVVCLLYDNSDPSSFEYVARIYLKYFSESEIPVLMVANKSDLASGTMTYLQQPIDFCQKHKLPPPHLFTTKGIPKKDIYTKLATMAAYPHLKQLGIVVGAHSMWLKVGLGLAAATAFTLLIVKAWRR